MRPVNLADTDVAVLPFSFVNCHIFQPLQNLFALWLGKCRNGCTFLHIYKSWRKAVTQIKCLLVPAHLCNALCQCSGAHSSICLIHTSRFSLALMPRTLHSVGPANVSLNFCGNMEQRLCNSSHGCTKVNGNCYIHFIFQMHSSSPSIQMWRDCEEANKMAGFNRTHRSSVSIDCAGCSLLKMEDVWWQCRECFLEQEAESDKKKIRIR